MNDDSANELSTHQLDIVHGGKGDGTGDGLGWLRAILKAIF